MADEVEKINCKNCVKDRHNECQSEDCLCRDNNHGVKIPTLKDGVKIDFDKPISQILEIDMELEDIIEVDSYKEDPIIASYKIIDYFIRKKRVIDKSKIFLQLNSWQKRFDLKWEPREINTVIENYWNDKDKFKKIKSIAYRLGIEKISIELDKGQNLEVGEWLRGRYRIKRIDIDGRLLVFNDCIYEQRAPEFIKRKARECLPKSTKADMNEILAFVEDTSDIITLEDIENFVHLKCLRNGVFDILTGEFSTEFDPRHIILNQIPHNFDESKTFKEIDIVVSEIISDEKDQQSFYDFISTCLHPYTGIDFQFGGVGQAGTGKSQLCDLVVLTLGHDNVSEASIHSIAKDPTTQIDIAYKMCNIDRDLSSDDIKQTEIIKKWITQDRLRARAIFEHSGDFRPTSRLLFMANDLYEISNHDDAIAIYERTQLVRIDNKFRYEDSQINKIITKVSTPDQLDGYITYLLKNAHKIYKNQKIHHPMKTKEVEEIWNLHGNRIRKFTKIWFEKITDSSIKTERSEVFDKWLSYALMKDFPPKGRDTFYKQFEEIMGMSATSTRRDNIQGRYYLGLKMKTKEEFEFKMVDDAKK